MARRLGALLAGAVLALTTVLTAYAGHGSTYRVSEGPLGEDPNDDSSRLVIARDGNFIVYHSRASNLVANDQHAGGTDVFATNITTPGSPTTTFVSKDKNGTNNPDGDSTFPAVSNDVAGNRYVVFQSVATNLLVGKTTAGGNIFRRNLATGVTELVSSKADGNDGPGNNTRPTVSCNGQYVAFNSTAQLVPGDTDTNTDAYLRDMSKSPGAAGWMTRISQTIAGGTNEDSIRAIIDCVGEYVAFASAAQLVAADTDDLADIYRWKRSTNTLQLVSVQNDESSFNRDSQRPWISPDGDWVVFQTAATNVPGDTNGNHDIYLRDVAGGNTVLVSLKADGTQPGGANTRGVVSNNGRYVAWAANSRLVNTDKNGRRDVYVRDMTLPTSTGIVRVSERTDHTEGACTTTTASSGGYTTAARAGTVNISTRPTISLDGMRIGYSSSFCTLDPSDGTPVDDIYLTVR